MTRWFVLRHMGGIHMGQLLERAIRRKKLNITELAAALGIDSHTLYSWFKQEAIDPLTMESISNVIAYNYSLDNPQAIIINSDIAKFSVVKDDAYWNDRYKDLLERYSERIAASGNQEELMEFDY